MKKTVWKFSSYEVAEKALKAGRRIIPTSYWYMTNEYGNWSVVEI